MDAGKASQAALALYFGGKLRAASAAFRELAEELSLEAEVENGLLAPDPASPAQIVKPLDHELVIGKVAQPGAKNLQACAAGSHDWGPYDPNIGGHECLACGTIYTRRA